MNTSWPEFEIPDLPPLRADEASLLDLHSLLNTLNVLHGELSLVGIHLADDDELLKPALEACREFVAGLRQRDSAAFCMRNFGAYRDRIATSLDQGLAQFPEKRFDPEVTEAVSNIESVFSIIAVRTREVLARMNAPEAWTCQRIADLHRNFHEVFSAIEKNSKGRYRIIFNLARQLPSDYYIHIDIDSLSGESIWMPPVFVDVMRDLIANARKYTPPGGSISAGLYEDEKSLRFVVEDTGRGIPEAEITEVVKFGRRGSNVADVRTMGGGFGLTKAVFVAKQFRGRMWIASQLRQGTRIRIEIPRVSSR